MVRPDAPLGRDSYWVVVADEFQATFYARAKKYSPLQEVSTTRNDTAREKTRDLISDKGGRAFDSHGQGRHTMASEKEDPKTRSAVLFAKALAQQIGSAKQEAGFDRLIVVAAPRFLGFLRQALAIAGIEPDRTIDKEMTGREPGSIKELVDAE